MINNINLTKISRVTEQSSSSNRQVASNKSGKVDADDVEISESTQLLSEMIEQSETEISAEQLDVIKREIRQGNYLIDYEALAEAIMDQSLHTNEG